MMLFTVRFDIEGTPVRLQTRRILWGLQYPPFDFAVVGGVGAHHLTEGTQGDPLCRAALLQELSERVFHVLLSSLLVRLSLKRLVSRGVVRIQPCGK